MIAQNIMMLLTASFDNFILDQVKSVVVDWPGELRFLIILGTGDLISPWSVSIFLQTTFVQKIC